MKIVKKKLVVMCSLIILLLSQSFLTQAQSYEKVITMGPNATELMVALGLEDKIIGTTLNNHSKGPLDEYQEIYESLPELAFGSASRESVLTSGADFIFGIDWEFGEEAHSIDELESYGMTVYVEDAKTPDEFFEEIKEISSFFDVSKEGEHLITTLKDELESVEINFDTPVSVLVYDSGQNGVFTASGANFESRLIELAGGNNIFSDITDKEWVTVSYEDILSRNPEYIIIHDYNVPSAENKIREIQTNPILSELDCVKNEQFIIVPLENFFPSVRMGKTVQQLNEAFKTVR